MDLDETHLLVSPESVDRMRIELESEVRDPFSLHYNHHKFCPFFFGGAIRLRGTRNESCADTFGFLGPNF